MIAALVLALAAVPSTTDSAPGVDQSTPVSPANLQLATRLIDLALPDSLVMQSNMEAWERGLRAAMLNDAGVAGVEKQFPGAVQAAIDAGRPVAKPYVWAQILRVKKTRTQVFAERMSEAELTDVLRFYESPVGKRFIASLFAKADPDVMINSVIERANRTGDFSVSQQDGDAVLRGAVREIAKTRSAADTLEIMKFERTAGAGKLEEVSKEADKASLEIFNSIDPAFMKRQHDTITGALLAFVEARKAAQK